MSGKAYNSLSYDMSQMRRSGQRFHTEPVPKHFSLAEAFAKTKSGSGALFGNRYNLRTILSGTLDPAKTHVL